MINNYYKLVNIQQNSVTFTDTQGSEHQLSIHLLLRDGLLEFFNEKSTKFILNHAKVSHLGYTLNRMNQGKLWVPYQRYQYFPFFSMIAFGSLLLSCLLTKQHIIIFDKKLYGSLFVLPLSFIFTDIVNELYGYRVAKNMIYSCALIMFILTALWYFIASCIPESTVHNNAWLLNLKQTYKTFIFNGLGLLCADILNSWIFHQLRAWLVQKRLWFRSLLSTCISQILYSFTVLNIYLVTSNTSLETFFCQKTLTFLFNNYPLKILYALIALPLIYLVCYLIKSRDYRTLCTYIETHQPQVVHLTPKHSISFN